MVERNSNKAILNYDLGAIKDRVDEILIIVGYKKNLIKKFVREKFPDLKVKFIEQKKQLGTGHAVSILEKYIKDKFILMLGDNLYSSNDIKNILKYEYSILVKTVNNPEDFGVVIEKNGIKKKLNTKKFKKYFP